MLNAVKLSKIYDGGKHPVHALVEVDLTVEEGEFVAVMGPSGSGKSTLLHLLGGLDSPTSGAILLDGKVVSSLSDKEATLLRRRNIGFVFQFYNLLPTLSAEENILLPLLIDGKKPKGHEKEMEALMEKVGILERRSHRPSELSGGEQQRVSLARALITKPKILLADEPTGNLDSKTGSQVMELLALLSEEMKQTVIMVTHDPKAASYADRLVYLVDGKIRTELHFEKDLPVPEKMKRILRNLEGEE
jgi:putative ABC transport system ATP-binding protein